MLIAFSVLFIGTAIGLVYYWIDFYVRGGVQVVQEDWYIRFEKAFVVADLWTAACALVSAIGMLTEQTYGLLFAFLTAGSLIFLCLMDVTANIQNKLYRLLGKSGQMNFELFINFWTLGLGVSTIVCLGPKTMLI